MRYSVMSLALLGILALSCGERQAGTGKSDNSPGSTSAPLPPLLGRYLFDAEPRTMELSDNLLEVSGIAFDGEGRLFAHGDEKGVIYELDTASGRITREFTLGKAGVKEDFEDIAIVGDRFYMTTSNGVIYEFSSGEDGRNVDFLTHTTGLTAGNDVEGLCHDPATNALLLACKADPGVPGRVRSVYSFSLAEKRLASVPRWILTIDDLTRGIDRRDFRPSAITRDPATGHFLLMTSADNAIAELDSTGTVLGAIRIRRGEHQQPEGLAISPDGTLYISDEAAEGVATVSAYQKRK